jgi:hypothetical protein
MHMRMRMCTRVCVYVYRREIAGRLDIEYFGTCIIVYAGWHRDLGL